jgi:hypothetical protein
MAENKTTDIKTQEEQIKSIVDKLDNKDFNIYFFTLDTMGNPVAGVANIYEHVKVLNELGYNAVIMHEKNDYKLHGDETYMGISDWLGEDYAKLPHISIESQELNIRPVDFIIIPEIFANIMDQVKKFPCKKIVFSQSYDYLLELLPIGKKWNVDYGFYDVITTSKKQSDYVKGLFNGINTHIIPVGISDEFKPSDKPKMPIVTIVTRNQGDAKKIANSFYLQYPMYKFITFKELRGMKKTDFADELGKSCLSVWIDDSSGFGTFPLESMASGTPVIGLIPNMIPEWMEETDENGNIMIKGNGIWTSTRLDIPELIGSYMKIWFEDSVPEDIINSMETTNGNYSMDKQRESIKEVYGMIVKNRQAEFLSMIKTNAKVNA